MAKMKFASAIAFWVILFVSLTLEARPWWVEQYEKYGLFYNLENSYIFVVTLFHPNDRNALERKLDNTTIERAALPKGVEIHRSDNELDKIEQDTKVRYIPIVRYIERRVDGYYGFALAQIIKNPSSKIEKMSISDTYTFSALVFVPGAEQFYKKQYLRGSLFLGGEVLLIGGIAASFGMSSYYKSRSDDKSLAQDKRNAFENRAHAAWYAGWTFVGAAAALYIWNILDGAFASGEPALFADGKKIAFAPVATPSSVGLAMNLNF